MYIIIKKNKAEHFSDKLRKIKAMACEVMEELEIACEKEYEEDNFHREYSRKDSRNRNDYDDDDYDREYSRGRSMRGGRGRY